MYHMDHPIQRTRLVRRHPKASRSHQVGASHIVHTAAIQRDHIMNVTYDGDGINRAPHIRALLYRALALPLPSAAYQHQVHHHSQYTHHLSHYHYHGGRITCM